MFNAMKHYREELLLSINNDRKLLARYPSGHLYCDRDRQYIKCYKVDTNGVKTYIPKASRNQAELLAEKLVIETRLSATEKELAAVNKYLSESTDPIASVAQLTSPKSKYSSLICNKFPSPDKIHKNWSEEKYEKNKGYSDNLTFHSPTGNILRSKSEMMIDMYLAGKGVSYRYESRLDLHDGSCIFPDFTILTTSGKKKYWEHCGMMSVSEYIESVKKRIDIYAEEGIYVNENLFLTFETVQAPLQMIDIEYTFNKIMLYDL